MLPSFLYPPAYQAFSFHKNAASYFFINIVFSYKYVYQSILSSVIKLIEVKQQVFLFLQEEYVESSWILP